GFDPSLNVVAGWKDQRLGMCRHHGQRGARSSSRLKAACDTIILDLERAGIPDTHRQSGIAACRNGKWPSCLDSRPREPVPEARLDPPPHWYAAIQAFDATGKFAGRSEAGAR